MSKKKSLFSVVEAKGEPFLATTKHTDQGAVESVLDEGLLAYTDPSETKPFIHISRINNPDKLSRLVPVMSHESLHLTLDKINEDEASEYLDNVHGYGRALNSSGITDKPLKQKFLEHFLKLYD